MRTGVIVALVISAVIITGGVVASGMAQNAAAVMISATAEATALVEMGEWARAEEMLQAYAETWHVTAGKLEPLIDNRRIEDVTDALRSACTAVKIQDRVMCAEALTVLQDAAQHLADREQFTLANLL